MEEFIRCPKCGELDERRSQCRRGYSSAAAAAAAAAPVQRRSAPGCLAAIGGRVALLLLVISAVVFYLGYQEYSVSKGATEQPEDVDLAKLEAGEKPAQNHIRIGKHLRLYDELIYVYSSRDKNKSDPSLTDCFYPIISPAHPDLVKLLANDGKDVKDDPAPIKNFAVLVKTNQFHRLADVPRKDPVQDSLQGMVVNDIKELSAQETKLIKESFPTMDTSKIIILEQGRTPTSHLQSFGMMGGAALVALVVIGLFFLGRKSS
jgi:hypothetical protein